MVGEDGEADGSEDNPEWENQIEEMLEAETKKSQILIIVKNNLFNILLCDL